MNKNVGYTETGKFTCLEDLDNTVDYQMFNPIVLDYCGKENCLPGHQFGPYIREKYVIHFVLEGKGTFLSGHKKYELTKGSAFIILPGEEATYRADMKKPWSYAWIGFHGYRVPEWIHKMGFSRENPVMELSNLPHILQIIEKILAEKQLTMVNELRRMSGLYEIMALIIESQMEARGTKKHDYSQGTYVKCAVDYMACNYGKKIKIDDLAEMIGISRSHLTLSFKKELNISPQEFLMNFRMEKACDRLKNTNDPINVIAAEVGYNDSLAFSKAFKQRMGESPKAYRETKIELIDRHEKGDYDGACPL
ncbi:MAG: helix-turn-helix domain-containing protein [Lachnospiraceae bacterium]|nr:helix-turn-helix domain-containing protein [Lachnospiraceae bacterium]